LFMDKPPYSRTYKVKTNTDQLFRGAPDDVLFLNEDYINLKYNNDTAAVKDLNIKLTHIQEMVEIEGSKLIVMISPDKYDMYYPYIADKAHYPAPKFFEILDALDKKYKLVPSHEVISKEIASTKDVYYYADTHWSPIAQRLMAKELMSIIREDY